MLTHAVILTRLNLFGKCFIWLFLIQVYQCGRLDERKQRKDFVLDRNLLIPDPSEKDLTLDERELSNHFKVFTRFHSKEKHDELLRSVIEERRILKRIEDLQVSCIPLCYFLNIKIRRHDSRKRRDHKK